MGVPRMDTFRAALEAQAQAARRDTLGPVRGMWECDQCHFIQQITKLNPITGASGAPTVAELPVCPNDGTAMRSRTWRDLCMDARGAADRWHEECEAAEAKLARVREYVQECERESLPPLIHHLTEMLNG